MKTYNDIYIDARKRLRDAGIEAYALEARLLLAFAADKTQEEFLRDIRLYPGDAQYQERAEHALQRRLNGEPAAYIVGQWEFCGLDFEINSNVLIPRPDTEVVVQAALRHLKKFASPRVLDLCCGSGCIGLTVAVARPDASVVLADIDRRALMVCKRNAMRHKIKTGAACVEADALAPPPKQLGSFDMIICNPPYIPTEEINGLDGSVKDFEPHIALDGGADGLDFFRSVGAQWRQALRPGGMLVFECGQGQSGSITDTVSGMGLTHVESVEDTLGIERAIVFQI